MQQRKADLERKQVATHDAYRAANQLRMADRRTLEWIEMFKAWPVFRYETSDLFIQGCDANSGQKAWVCS